jgi:hypothetical protein
MAAARGLLPDRKLRPIALWPGAACLTVAVFDYRATSIGPYGELGVGIPCRSEGSTALPLIPILLERRLRDVGYWIVTLPVTTESACAAGRSVWGYPKYVGAIDISVDGDVAHCTVSDAGEPVVRVEIRRPGPSRPQKLPLRTYSKLDDEIHLTEVAIDGHGSLAKLGVKASLTFFDHARNRTELGALPRAFESPVEVRWFDQYRLQLDRARARYPLSAPH